MTANIKIGSRTSISLPLMAMAGFLHCAAASETFPKLEANVIERALVDGGDNARLHKAMAKARRGESVTLAVIGGSITKGAGASKPENRWASLVQEWWKAKFPKSETKFVNAGIGATGSDYGVFRFERDLLPHNPDVIIAEFAVNDPAGQRSMETMEGLLRKILKQPKPPAVLQLFTMHKDGSNSQEEKTKLGKHYGIPMTSYRDALWPEIESKKISFKDITTDVVHPNDRGHRYAADFVITMLENALAKLPEDSRLPAIAPMPKPLVSGIYENTVLFDRVPQKGPLLSLSGAQLNPTGTKGKCDTHDNVHRMLEPGVSELEFMIPGERISLHILYSRNFYAGMGEIIVDDGKPQPFDTWWHFGFDSYQFLDVCKDLGPGPHKVAIRLLKDKNPQAPKYPESYNGAPSTISIMRIGVAGAGCDSAISK